MCGCGAKYLETADDSDIFFAELDDIELYSPVFSLKAAVEINNWI